MIYFVLNSDNTIIKIYRQRGRVEVMLIRSSESLSFAGYNLDHYPAAAWLRIGDRLDPVKFEIFGKF